MPEEDSFHLDILKGLSAYFESPFVADIRDTAKRFPDPSLGYALNHNQITSKKWLIDSLFEAAGGEVGQVCILGGWYGVLGAMLLHDPRFTVASVVSVDLDPACKEIAESLNRTHAETARFESRTADMLALDYDDPGYDLVINTSCEHVAAIGDWFRRIPDGTLLVLQSNNYYGIEGHVNCVDDLDAFKRQMPISDSLFEGALALSAYTRFMLIGRK